MIQCSRKAKNSSRELSTFRLLEQQEEWIHVPAPGNIKKPGEQSCSKRSYYPLASPLAIPDQKRLRSPHSARPEHFYSDPAGLLYAPANCMHGNCAMCC